MTKVTDSERIRHWLERMTSKNQLSMKQKKLGELMLMHGYSYNCVTRHVKNLECDAQAQRSFARLKAGEIHGRVGQRVKRSQPQEPLPKITGSKDIDWPVYDGDDLTMSRVTPFSKQEMITMLSISEVIPTLMRTQLIATLAE
jgi:hypothetical protein